MLVFDRTGSMGYPAENNLSKLNWAQEAIYSLIDTLESANSKNVRLGLVSYNTSAALDNPMTNTYSDVRTAVSSLTSNGSTCIQCGLKIANDNNTNTSTKRVGILMSDGVANYPDSTTASQKAIDEADKGRQNGIEYYAISYGDDADPEAMSKIANLPTAQYYRDSPGADQLKQVYQDILKDICK
jgi:Mg-chelatase subunit ChlD